jgi:hypothetical protein
MCLFLINTKSLNPHLSLRRLVPQELLFKAYYKAVNAFPRDGEERFKIVYAKLGDVDKYLKLKTNHEQNFDDQSQVVSQLGNAIINNKTYERKGKLLKKSLNSDKFKERRFVLDKDQLFYYKNEKSSKHINISSLLYRGEKLQSNHAEQSNY